MDVRPRASGGHAGPITLSATGRRRSFGTDGPKGGLDWAAIFACALPVVLFVLSAGCRQVDQRQGKSPLQPAQMSPDSIALDISFVRFPFGQAEANGRLWEEIDEQGVASDVRQRLIPNGFRAGLVSDPMPEGLAKLLESKEKPASAALPHGAVADLEKEPRVVTRRLQLRAEHRAEVACSEVYERMPVLIRDRLGVTGGDLYQAQGMIIVTAHLEPDRRVRLDLVPEVQSGESKPRFVGGQGGFRLETSRPRRAFDELALHTTLLPGQSVVFSSLANRPGSLGHHFFTQEAEGKLEQKLLVIRLAQTQHDDLFDPRAPQPLNVLADESK
jgi:hypothetical protein